LGYNHIYKRNGGGIKIDNLYVLKRNTGGNDTMDFKVIEKDSFKIVGKEIRVRCDNGENNKLIPEFWQKSMAEGIFDVFGAMPNIVNNESSVSMGMCMDFDGINNTFSYLICVEVSNFDCIPEGMVGKTIPAAKYAVFTAKAESRETMTQAIQATWDDIYSKWLPASNYERTDAPDFEYYDERCDFDKPEVDIYIPIR
jgi:AraC family transcriptional regulator